MWDATRFWLKLGVDGYRLDAIGTIFERPDMPEHPGELTDELRRALHHGFPDGSDKNVSAAWEKIYQYQHEQPGVHELMQELRQVIDEFPDRMLVGENSDVRYHGDGNNELHMVFNFPLMRTNRITPAWVRANQKERLATLPKGAWPCNTLNNHDTPRLRTKFGDGTNDEAIARTSAALMLTLRGTPFLYNGEELGMPDYYLTDISQFADLPSILFYHQEIEKGVPPEVALARAAHDTRDRCRTPFQWRNAHNAGFSPEGVRTWLPVNPNYAQGLNAADEQADPKSMLNFYKQLLRIRKEHPALVMGEYVPLLESSENVFAFLRRSTSPQETCLVAINLCDQSQQINIELPANAIQCIYSTHKPANQSLTLSDLTIESFEILIIELTSS